MIKMASFMMYILPHKKIRCFYVLKISAQKENTEHGPALVSEAREGFSEVGVFSGDLRAG